MSKLMIEPVRYRVLIKPDEVDEKTGSLYMPQNTRDRKQEACDRGTLIAMGEMAFLEWEGRKPKVGDRVLFNRYAGSIVSVSEESEKFRLCNDEDIGAILNLSPGADLSEAALVEDMLIQIAGALDHNGLRIKLNG